MFNIKKTILVIGTLLSSVFTQAQVCNSFQSSLCPDFGIINAKINQQTFETEIQNYINEYKILLLDVENPLCNQNDLNTEIDNKARYLKSHACSVILLNNGCQVNTSICSTICPSLGTSLRSISCTNKTVVSNVESNCNNAAQVGNSCKDYSKLELSTCGFSNKELKTAFCLAAISPSHYTCCVAEENNTQPPSSPSSSTLSPTSEITNQKTNNEKENKEEESGGIFSNKIFLACLIGVVVTILILGFFYYVGRGEDDLEDDTNNGMKTRGYVDMSENQHKTSVNNKSYRENGEMNNSYHNITNNNSFHNNSNPYSMGMATGMATGMAGIAASNSKNKNNNNEISNPFDDRNKSNIDNYEQTNSYNNMNNSVNKNRSLPNNEVSYQSPTLYSSPSNINNNNNTNDYMNAINPQNPFDSPKLAEMNTDSYQQLFDEPSALMVNMIDIPKPKETNTNMIKKDNDEVPKKAMVNLTEIPKPQQNSTNIIKKNDDEVPKKAMVNLTEIPKPQQNSTNIIENDDDEVPMKAMVSLTEIPKPQQNSTNIIEKNGNDDDEVPMKAMVSLTEIPKPQQNSTNIIEKNGNDDDEVPMKAMVSLTEIPKPQQNSTNIIEDTTNEIIEPQKPNESNKVMITVEEVDTPINTTIKDAATDNDDFSSEKPKKAMVNIIDIMPPTSAEINRTITTDNRNTLDMLGTPSLVFTPSLDLSQINFDYEQSQSQIQIQDEPSLIQIQDESSQIQYESSQIQYESSQIQDEPSQIQDEPSQIQDVTELPEAKPYNAIHSYEPQINDELRLNIGDNVDVIYEYDDGWVWAINKTTGEQGACPMLCLASIKEEETGEREWEKEMDLMKVPGRRDSMLSLDMKRLSQLKKY